MTKIEETIHYIAKNFPSPGVITLTKMVYLVDWRHAIVTGKQFTEIKWRCEEYGPVSHEIITTLTNNSVTELRETEGADGNVRIYAKDGIVYSLDPAAKEAIDLVIKITRDSGESEMQKIINSTFPVLAGQLNVPLDFTSLVKQYKEARATLKS
jgi:hypothetical protein